MGSSLCGTTGSDLGSHEFFRASAESFPPGPVDRQPTAELLSETAACALLPYRQHDMPRQSLHVDPHGVVGIARHYIRDLVYGANDGIITTFAVVAGVAGGSLSTVAV